jgi:hypothetical protein
MRRLLLALSICLIGVGVASAEGGKTLASTMEVYVFPTEGQQADQQSKDEASCYEWAANNTDKDPFELQKQSVAQAEQTEKEKAAAEQVGQGAGARGALRGAAAGALIGEIANDDASEGAAWGAAAGAIRGRRHKREAQGQATAQAEQKGQQKQQATAAQVENFKKAFSVCLEAKDYLVKY